MTNQRNRNRQGYKKTKVGWIPEDWDVKHIIDVANVNPGKPEINTNDTTVSFISMSDVSVDGRIINHQKRDYASVYKGYTGFSNGDILVAKITPCFENGKGLLATSLENGIGFGSTEFHVIRATQIDPLFLFHHTMSFDFRKRGTTNMIGSAGQRRIPGKFIKSYALPVPSRAEQKKIAEILSTCDRTIHLTTRMIEAKTRMKKGLMQQLLTGQMRFPEFGKPATKKGELPEGWQIKRLSDIALINPETISEKTPGGYKFCYIDIGAVKEGNITFPSSEVRFENAPSRARRRINRNDILLSTVRPNLKGFAHIEFSPDNYICSTGFAVIRTKECYASLYIYYNLYSSYTEKYFNGCVLGSNYPALNNSDIEQLRIPCPSEIEQKKIAETLSTLDDEIKLLRKQEAAHKKQKKALMQKLLFGEIRVNTISNDITSNNIENQVHGSTENRV
jgi:type I restriction enzyme, S subunit